MKLHFHTHIISLLCFIACSINAQTQLTQVDGSTVCVTREDDYPITGVELIPGIETDASGCHTFDNPDGIIVTPVKTAPQEQGVNVLDMIMLYEYLLSQRTLNDYQQWAADMNNSAGVTAIDLVEIAKLIHGTLGSPLSKIWKFYEEISYEPSIDISDPEQSYHFIGIKTGDLEFSFDSPDAPDLEDIFIKAEDEILNDGETYLIPLYLSQAENMVGFSVRISNPNQNLEFLSVTAPNLPGFDFLDPVDIHAGETTIVYVCPGLSLQQGVPVTPDLPILILEIKAHANTILHDELILEPSFANLLKPAAVTALDMHFEWEDVIINSVASLGPGHELTLYPNPVSDQLNIKGLKAEDKGIMQIFDATGRLVFASELLPTRDLSSLAAGMYYVNIRMEDGNSAVIPLVKND